MATSSSCSLLKQHFIILSFLFAITTGLHSPVTGCFTSIFSFGDSITDTGNLLAISRSESIRLPPSAFLPNGRTFFRHPSGRRCDGRLIIDFLAEALGFPFLPPYYGSSEQLEHGANFAVAGACALNSSFLAERGIPSHSTNISLGVQVNSFKHLLPSLCSSSSDCKEFLRTSLIVMGEIGGNDYTHAIREGIKTEEIQEFVPLVVERTDRVWSSDILVPGQFPMGCSPSVLTQFQGSDKDNYDPSTGCLTWPNQFSEQHSELLRKELEKLRTQHPDANIVFVDYYDPAMRIYHSPKEFGFKETLKACCGTGGLYNFNHSKSCGYPPLERCCNDPSSYVSWDGIHYTEAMYKLLADVVFEELMNTIPTEALGFPFLPPYYGCRNGSSEQLELGVNFAVAGAFALNSSFLAERGITSTTNISLGVQVNSFKHFLPSLCSSSSDRKEFLRTSLIVMGVIGGNDYTHAIGDGINIEEIREFVPLVVESITSSINELIEFGAVTFLVPGQFPMGCSPSLLTQFQGSDKDNYDPSTGCLTWPNQFSKQHSELLRKELGKLRTRHPDANIVYVDYYDQTMRIYHSPKQFGFKETLKACCGTGGLYNFNPSIRCGYPPLERCCNDPYSYISWDGIHYTEAMYRLLADVVFEELMSTIPSLNNLCPTSNPK
ncbi:hypothetical protein GQ457_09G031200 [Hibiscus cannabinus]